MYKVKKGTSGLNFIDLASKGESVANNILENATVFDKPTVAPSLLLLQCQTLRVSAETFSMIRSQKNRIDRKNAKKNVLKSITSCANYVNSVAGGDSKKINLAGFQAYEVGKPSSRNTKSSIPPDLISNLRVKSTNVSGTLKVQWKGNVYAKSYIVKLQNGKTAEMKYYKTLTDNSLEAINLIPGTYVGITVQGINSHGEGGFCAPVYIYVN